MKKKIQGNVAAIIETRSTSGDLLAGLFKPREGRNVYQAANGKTMAASNYIKASQLIVFRWT